MPKTKFSFLICVYDGYQTVFLAKPYINAWHYFFIFSIEYFP